MNFKKAERLFVHLRNLHFQRNIWRKFVSLEVFSFISFHWLCVWDLDNFLHELILVTYLVEAVSRAFWMKIISWPCNIGSEYYQLFVRYLFSLYKKRSNVHRRSLRRNQTLIYLACNGMSVSCTCYHQIIWQLYQRSYWPIRFAAQIYYFALVFFYE